jgi:acyl dehydratase
MLEKIALKVDEEKWKAHPRTRVGAVKKVPKAEKMTPELLERRNFRMNKPFIPPRVYFNTEATRDTILHFVNGFGDTNPLFSDEAYAQKSKYGKIIAPGSFLYTHQWTTLGGGFSGIHAWYSGGDWEWYRPVYVDTKLSSVAIVRDLVIKKGRKAGGGNIYIDYGDIVYLNAETREILGKELYHTVWAERDAAGSSKKERRQEKAEYSREDWLKILELYDTEDIRGPNPRYWEDVAEGDKVGPMIKGPLTVRDELAWIMGGGSPFFKAHKIEMDFEHRHPKALEYVEETNEADVPELVHVLDQFARNIGIEYAYDYGNQRMTWLCNLFTNWMGDDAFLWKMSGDLRVFNQMGDLTIFEGKVVKKYVDDGKHCVDIEAWAKNQREEWSMPPQISTVILPSKEGTEVSYPDPKPELVEEVNSAKPLYEMVEQGLI